MRANTRAQAPDGGRARPRRAATALSHEAMRTVRCRVSRPRRRTITGYALRLATATALVIDAVVHLQDAHFYDISTGPLVTQGQLFRIQAVVAIVAALAVLAWPRWPSWLFAALVSASAAAAVVTYTYVNVGPIAGLLPNMYEPSWGPPGKLFSAYAETAGALLALTGLAYVLARRQRAASQNVPADETADGPLAPAPHR